MNLNNKLFKTHNVLTTCISWHVDQDMNHSWGYKPPISFIGWNKLKLIKPYSILIVGEANVYLLPYSNSRIVSKVYSQHFNCFPITAILICCILFLVQFLQITQSSLSRPASQNTLKRSRDESRRRIYARKIPYVYMLSLKWPKQVI